MSNQKNLVVLCREDRKDETTPGKYVLATRRFFHDLEAAKDYAKSISSSREPLVALVVWKENS